jgi:hypothetical protein
VEGKKRLTIAEVIWTYQGTITSNSVKVRAKQLGGYDIKIQNAQVDKVKKTITGHDLPAVKDFDPKVKFFDPLVLVWEISLDGGKTFTEAGTSQNPIYFCLKGPVDGIPRPFRTVAHLACSNDGAEASDPAVEKTWELFLGKNVKGWDETTKGFTRTLYYYKPGTTFDENSAGGAAALLQSSNDSGQCTTWACLLRDACKLNDANVMIIRATPKDEFFMNPIGFLVKAWSHKSNAPWEFRFNAPISDMIPDANNGVYGDFSNLPSVAGQNSAPPSQKAFGSHFFVRHTKANSESEYLDPSYGAKYLGSPLYEAELDFQSKAIEMYAINSDTVSSVKIWGMNKPYYVFSNIRFEVVNL